MLIDKIEDVLLTRIKPSVRIWIRDPCFPHHSKSIWSWVYQISAHSFIWAIFRVFSFVLIQNCSHLSDLYGKDFFLWFSRLHPVGWLLFFILKRLLWVLSASFIASIACWACLMYRCSNCFSMAISCFKQKFNPSICVYWEAFSGVNV